MPWYESMKHTRNMYGCTLPDSSTVTLTLVAVVAMMGTWDASAILAMGMPEPELLGPTMAMTLSWSIMRWVMATASAGRPWLS